MAPQFNTQEADEKRHTNILAYSCLIFAVFSRMQYFCQAKDVTDNSEIDMTRAQNNSRWDKLHVSYEIAIFLARKVKVQTIRGLERFSGVRLSTSSSYRTPIDVKEGPVCDIPSSHCKSTDRTTEL